VLSVNYWRPRLSHYELHNPITRIPGAAKSNRLKLLAVFSATAWNFSMIFHRFTWLSYLHLNSKWHLIIFKHDEVIDILAWPLSDFRALKNVCAEKLQNRVAETTRWTDCPMFDSHFMCSNCSPSAFVHVFSRSVELLTVLLIGPCARLSQITCNASFSDFFARRKTFA